jgi:hypothetical protein
VLCGARQHPKCRCRRMWKAVGCRARGSGVPGEWPWPVRATRGPADRGGETVRRDSNTIRMILYALLRQDWARAGHDPSIVGFAECRGCAPLHIKGGELDRSGGAGTSVFGDRTPFVPVCGMVCGFAPSLSFSPRAHSFHHGRTPQSNLQPQSHQAHTPRSPTQLLHQHPFPSVPYSDRYAHTDEIHKSVNAISPVRVHPPSIPFPTFSLPLATH